MCFLSKQGNVCDIYSGGIQNSTKTGNNASAHQGASVPPKKERRKMVTVWGGGYVN